MKFEIILNEIFDDVKLDDTLSPTNNKSVLGLINDFEILNDGEGSILAESAKKLRLIESIDAIGRGNEIAEIVLYGIMKNHYSALPIVPKIFYKQNQKDEAKGSDSVHIVVESEDSFSLWFGESKFYNGIENARLSTIVASVKDSVSLEKIRKENSIITNLSDINDFEEISDDLRIKIKTSLSQDESIDKIKPILNIPILLLYECEQTKIGTHLTDEYKQGIIDAKAYRD